MMVKLITATDSIEARLILNLLEQAELLARIDGEYLQGGVGDLMAFGSIRVMVAEDDYAEAKGILESFLNADIIASELGNGLADACEH